MWWVGYFEQLRPPVLVWFFHVDYSNHIRTAFGALAFGAGIGGDFLPLPLSEAPFPASLSDNAPHEALILYGTDTGRTTDRYCDEVPEQDIAEEPTNALDGLPEIPLPLLSVNDLNVNLFHMIALGRYSLESGSTCNHLGLLI